MISWRNGAAVGVAIAASAIFQNAAIPSAHAIGCPDAEVIFARGTTEAPGPGYTGTTFIDTLRGKLAGKSVQAYSVDYPATLNFDTAVTGIADARSRILATAAACPDTKLVLGGFSQGAAVMGFVTASAVPEGVDPATVPAPMPPEISEHVAAVALFGKPSPRFMHAINDPAIAVGPEYAAKTVDLCVVDDLVCDPAGRSFSAHNQYFDAGMVDRGATFAADALQSSWSVTPPESESSVADRVPIPVPEPVTTHLSDAPVSVAPLSESAPLGPLPGPAVLPDPPPVSAPVPVI